MKEPLQALAVGLLGVGSSACGFIAEATGPKRDDISLQGGECMYPRSPAFALGFVEGALLLLAVALITGRCYCKCRYYISTMNLKVVVGILSVVMAWCIALRVGLLLSKAMAANRPGSHGKAPECYDDYLQSGNLFSAAAYNAILVTYFGILSGQALIKGAEVPAS